LANDLFDPIPLTTPDLPNNIITRDRVDLGAMLFFDPRMSRSGLFSCQSCHNVGLGGVDGLETSIGHGWQAGPRNSPTVYNAVFNIAQFWDGRAEDLAAQAMGPVVAGVEMNNTPDRLLETLNSMEEYVQAFEAAFPGEDDPVTFENFARAIEAFEATLITPNAPFDQFLNGADALNEQEIRGLNAFIDQGCAGCHAGVNMQPTSRPEKKYAISSAAVSGASEPCTEFSPTRFGEFGADRARAASAGLVAPITSRFLAMAPSPSSTCTTTGSEAMNSHSSS
jgi:cytochrome c peroxidase